MASPFLPLVSMLQMIRSDQNRNRLSLTKIPLRGAVTDGISTERLSKLS